MNQVSMSVCSRRFAISHFFGLNDEKKISEIEMK